ncbi:MAG: HAD-IB family hydrolase [Anaerolineales bacterium]|nr:HAD-IB family hydrolase [Anaerolineales bacterium]
MIAAIFDLDGTLYTGHIWRGITEHHRTFRTKRFLLYTYTISHIPFWWMQKAGLISEEAGRAIWARDLAWTIRGWTVEEGAEAFKWITSEYVMPRVRPNIMARLRNHQQFGHRVILVSGTMSPMLEEIGHQMGIDETVGTPPKTRRGRYTGAVELPVCQGTKKVLRLKMHLEGTDGVDWADSWSYADSNTDLKFLEIAGNPVAVYPDPILKEHARDNGWEIIDDAEEEADST